LKMKKVMENQKESEFRRRAEEKLKEATGGSEDLSDVSPERMARLIHELEVHQIELEMQNDELRGIQAELENARDRYSDLYDFAPVGYFSVSEKGIIDQVNLTGAAMIGIERSALIAKPFTGFVLRDDQDIFYKLRQRLLETETPHACELRLVKKNGQAFYARLECLVIKNQGDNLRRIRAAVSDISKSKQAQESLLKAHDELERMVAKRTRSLNSVNEKLKREIENHKHVAAALKSSEEKYRSLVESTQDSIYLVDEDCNYLFMNSKHRNKLGLSSSDIDHAAYAAFHTKEETAAFREIVQKVFETGRPLSYAYHSNKDGNYFVRTLSPLLEGETVKAVSVVSKDVTAQRQAEREAYRNRLQLAHLERVATMGELAASLAHEISQPLTAILSNAQAALRFIRSNPPEIDEVDAIIQDIIEDDRRAREFIQHLRAFFKRGELEKKSLDINRLINDAVSLFKSEAVFRHVFIETALDLKLPAVLANEIHVQQVILNLVLNASESMLEVNDRPKKVVISTMRENASCLKIGIRDSGKGIDPENHAAIFKPYFTTKKDGMGMGLAICRSIVEAHGGKIWVENNPDQGATFYFTLPIADEGRR
jgi:PAS domain S-box-containing protein